MNNRHACTATHCITSATRRSGWIQTSQLSALLHPADPDLQPHVGVAQVRPKTVLRWSNHHIQRHPPDHTVTGRGEALLQVPSPNAKQTKPRKKRPQSCWAGTPTAHSQVFQEKRAATTIDAPEYLQTPSSSPPPQTATKKSQCSDHKNS